MHFTFLSKMNDALEMLAPGNDEAKLAFKEEILKMMREPAWKTYDYNDILLELLYRRQGDLSEVMARLKRRELFHQHPAFREMANKVEEMDHFMDKPFEAQEGVNECKKCKSKRTLSYARQIRSGDEGMTVMVFCIECKYRYSMNS